MPATIDPASIPQVGDRIRLRYPQVSNSNAYLGYNNTLRDGYQLILGGEGRSPCLATRHNEGVPPHASHEIITLDPDGREYTRSGQGGYCLYAFERVGPPLPAREPCGHITYPHCICREASNASPR